MSLNKFVVNIEGDYVDSYIYSGYLVLVDGEYRLSIYKWRELFDHAISKIGSLESIFLRELMNDSRKLIPENIKSEIVINKRDLEKARKHTIDIGVWPTDINIFSNKLFISSENGLIRMDLDYSSGELNNERKLFDEICFSVSPNSFDRLAFAAGKEGVLTLIPKSKFYNSNDAKPLISGVCLDLDWQSTMLIANTVDGVIKALYQQMPSPDDFKSEQEFFHEINRCKSLRPDISNAMNAKFSWIAGDKIYQLNHDNSIDINSQGSTLNRKVSIEGSPIRARTAAFGTIVETNDSLIAIIDGNPISLAKDTVSWRVFPRAKNYANHLHIVNDDHVSINIIESRDNNEFGFDPEKIDLVG